MRTNTSDPNKRIVKNSAFLYIRMFITMCIGLYTSRAVLDALGVENYGIYNIVAGFVALLHIFMRTITNATQRFLTFEIGKGDKKKLKDTFSTFVIVLLFFGLLVLTLGTIWGAPVVSKYLVIPVARIDAAIFVFYCSLLSFVINLISIPYTAVVIAHEKMNFYAYISIGESVMKLLFAISLYYIPFDSLKVYALNLVLLGGIVRIIYRIYCKKRFEETHWGLVVRRQILKEVSLYSLWVSIGATTAILKEQGVNILINRFLGVLTNAARGVSMQVYGIINQFSSSIGSAIIPQITKSYASGDINRSVKLTFLLAKSQGIVLFFVSLPLLLETEYVLGLWLKEVPDYACVFTRWALVLGLARTLENTQGPLVMATGKVRNLQIVAGILMLLNLPLSYIALKMGCEPVSTMIIGVVLEIVDMFVAYMFLKYLVGFPVKKFYFKVIFPMLFVFTISSIIPFSFRFYLMNESFLRLVAVCLISGVSTAFFTFFILLNKNEKEMIVGYIQSKFKKIYV